MRRCSLCGGRLDLSKRCTLCGLDNTQNDEMYRHLVNRSDCADKPLTHVHAEKTNQNTAHSYSKGKSITRKIKNIARFVLSHIMKVIPQKYFIGKIDRIMTRYNHVQTERKGNLFYPRPANVFYNLFPLQDGVFEGMPVKLPGDWDRHLRLRYGNYMEFPPEEERIGHIPYILDFGKY